MINTKYAPIAPLMMVDCYKLSHKKQYDTIGNVTKIYSNFTNRKSRIEGLDGVVHFGLQAFLQEYCIDAFKPFFAATADEVCKLYAERVSQVIGTPIDDIDTTHIRKLHELGYLPLEFKSLPEGTIVPFKVPSFTVENTHPDFYWLPNYIETILSTSIWHPSTSATISHRIRLLLEEWADKTGADEAGIDFQGHDFSYRGQTSNATAAASGAGHLLSFKGSDSLNTLDYIDYYYSGANNGQILASVPATEHSVMSTGIAVNGEQETFKRLMEAYPNGILSIVSDTFDLWTVINEYLPALKDDILARDGKLVVRPDTGNPADIVCGTKSNPNTVSTQQLRTMKGDPEYFGVLELLWKHFGGTINKKGYKELDSHIGVIYGDGMNYDTINEILTRMEKAKFASSNVVFGMGSYNFQGNITRDTF